jgi:phage-related protein
MADYLGDRTGLYELRPSPHRVIYYYFEKGKIVLVHALRKRSDRLPKPELEKAAFNKEVSEIYVKHDMIDYEKELEENETP